MSKTAIGWLYFISILLSVAAPIIFFPAQRNYNYWDQQVRYDKSCEIVTSNPDNSDCYGNRLDRPELGMMTARRYVQLEQEDTVQRDLQNNLKGLAILGMIIGGLLGMIAWIGTLINLSRGQQWAWFILTFFFGGIMLFIYLIGGPTVPKTGQTPQAAANASPGVQPTPPQAYQPQPSALEVLQLRFARGEIDAATFHQMSEQLRSSERR